MITQFQDFLARLLAIVNLLVSRLARMGKSTIIFPILLMMLIFVLSSIPGDDDVPLGIVMQLKPHIQNLLHLPSYTVLAVLWFCALMNFESMSQHALKLAIIISFSYGLLDEVHQYFIPGRYASVIDVMSNSLGVT